jgi:nucleotide-binding universal stress UspA family protein
MAIDIERILVPLDFSENTPALLDWASHLAEEHSSKVILLHAYTPARGVPAARGRISAARLLGQRAIEAEEQLAEHAAPLRTRGLAVETAVCEGYAATVIIEEAARLEVDLIVIGTHGLSGLKHLLLGSIAERVVQKAPCPVLTVKSR